MQGAEVQIAVLVLLASVQMQLSKQRLGYAKNRFFLTDCSFPWM